MLITKFSKNLAAIILRVMWFVLTAVSAEAQPQSPEYHIDQAYQLYEKGQWQKALQAMTQLLNKSPYNENFLYIIGDINYQLGNYDEAIAAFKRNAEYGSTNGLSYTCLSLSRAYLKSGNLEEAFEYLIKAFELNIELRETIETDNLFSVFRSRAQYNEFITGKILPERYSRNDAWRADLQYLEILIERTHFDPFNKNSKENWEETISRVYEAIPQLEDYEVIIELQRISAMAGDGHTAVYNPRLPSHAKYAFHHFPLMPYYFGDDLYVRAASEQYKNLVGKRIIRIGERDLSEIERDLLTHRGFDNSMQFRWMAPWYLVVPEILKYYGAGESLMKAELTVADERGKKEIVVVETQQLLTKSYLRSTAPEDWINMRDTSFEQTPYYLQDPDNTFWHIYIEDKDVVYFQINNLRDKKNEKLKDHADTVIQELSNRNAEALIIDLRLNNGGNSRLIKPLIKTIIANKRIDQRGKLFVVTSRNTFSAAMNLCSALQKWTNAIFVGEPTGSSPNFIGEEKNVRLPYSGLTISISNTSWMGGLDSQDSREWIAPELGAHLTAKDYRNNIDPSFETIMEYLAQRHKKTK